jgi:hypothetical protein
MNVCSWHIFAERQCPARLLALEMPPYCVGDATQFDATGMPISVKQTRGRKFVRPL